MRNYAPLAVLLVAVAGCKPKLEDQIVGSWGGPNNATITIAKDKTWTSKMTMGRVPIDVKGGWTVAGDAATLTPSMVNGQPAAQVVEMAKAMGVSKAQFDALGQFLAGTDYTLGADGKTLTPKAAGRGQGVVLTKK
ncbi:MAG: hypothetical protein ACO1SV_14740 [Fimbriimonas sp.]